MALRQLFRRQFSVTAGVKSNIGSAPIFVPDGTRIKLSELVLDEVAALRLNLDKMRNGKPKIHITKNIHVEGPKGKVQLGLADFVKFNLSEDNKTGHVSVENPQAKHERSMWGTSRTLISNAITGVNEGHMCIVKFVGTGFRAIHEKDKNQLVLRVGFCVPQIVPIPEGLDVQVPVPHRVIIEGCDKQQVKLLAAEIRRHRKPEPYKGKGIFIDDETIKLKQKKVK